MLFRSLLVLTAFGFGDVARAQAHESSLPVDKIAATNPWGGELPTWRSHIRKGFDGGRWNKKCAAGKRMARNNPHQATIKPPACIRT